MPAMMHRRPVLIATLVCGLTALLHGAPKAQYDYYLTGSATDVSGVTTLGIGLMGGGTDVDALFTWMSDRAGGGDFVVIRASGEDGYNQYVFDLGDFDSVETLVLKNRSASSDPFVLQTIRNAEALFIAGTSPTTSTIGRGRQSRTRFTSWRRRAFRLPAPAPERRS